MAAEPAPEASDPVIHPDATVHDCVLGPWTRVGARTSLSEVSNHTCDPSDDDPQILLIRQYRYAAERYLYEVPAGRLDANEAPEHCARRELREETGCEAERVEHMFTMYTTPGFTDERIHVFMAVGLTRGEVAREPDEFIEVETLPLSRALGMVERGEIQDGKTSLALLYAAGFRAGR